jgi:L-Ala-D/L-Glu epimerase
MALEALHASSLQIPFKLAFKHASAERVATQAVWVQATGGAVTGYGEGCPREYVTGESIASARAFIDAQVPEWLLKISDCAALRAWVDAHTTVIDAHPAAWSAVETALLDLFGKQARKSVETMLGLQSLAGRRFHYTAVLGDAPAKQFEAQIARYRAAGFGTYKIKLSGDLDRDQAKVRALRAAGVQPDNVRADANNVWPNADTALRALEALAFPFAGIEEPLQAGDMAGMARIAMATGTAIILDESLARANQLDELQGRLWIANVRVSKMGGVLRSLDVMRAAQAKGLRTIVGAHVGETSVLARAALTVAGQTGDALFAQEGAFGTHLLEWDVAEPPLMFGGGGVLDAAALADLPGWGLRIRDTP